MPNTDTSLLEREVDGVRILTPRGPLKGAGERGLRDRLDGLVRGGWLHILIDLRHLTYMDSTDLGRLIRCHISVRQAGGRVRLCNLSDRVRGLMRISRLDSVLDIYDSEEEALESIRAEALSGD